MAKPTARQRRQVAANVARDERLAAAVTPAFRRAFAAEWRAVSAAIPRGSKAVQAAVTNKRWAQPLNTIWLGVAVDEVWDVTLADLAGVKARPASVPYNVWRRLQRFALGQQESITARTRSDLLGIFRDNPDAAESIIRDLTRKLYVQYGDTRAGRLAIQQVLEATNSVQHLAAIEYQSQNRTGPDGQQQALEKTWVSVLDDATRVTHSAADGQTVPLVEPFIVGGYDLDYPRDPSGPIEEIINCRCSEVYTQ